jgi:hypothetical protein
MGGTRGATEGVKRVREAQEQGAMKTGDVSCLIKERNFHLTREVELAAALASKGM